MNCAATTKTTRQCYVVQRCWYSGPHHFPPLDYLHLFSSKLDAEQVAYHSALVAQRSAAKNGEAHHPPSPIRMPGEVNALAYPTTQGYLFWVRAVQAEVVHGSDGGNFCDSRMMENEEESVFAIVTEGVIGGTGNRNSRRGVEVSRGCVFIGSSLAAVRFRTLQVCYGQEHHAAVAALGTRQVFPLSTGRITEFASGRFLQKWPGFAAANAPQDNALQQQHGTGKRMSFGAQSLPPSPKRRRRHCGVQPSTAFWHETPQEDAEMVMT